MKKIVIASASEMGIFLAKRLASEGQHVMVLDRDMQVLRELQETSNVAVFNIDTTDLARMSEAGIEGADLFLATADEDETNLVACTMANKIGVKRKIAITYYLGADDRSLLFSPTMLGIDTVINIGNSIKSQVLRSIEVSGANDFASFGNGHLTVLGCVLTEESELIGQRLTDLITIEHETHIHIVHATRDREPLEKDHALRSGDYVHLVTPSLYLPKANMQLGLPNIKGQRVIIHGDNFLSQLLAGALAEHHFKVCILNEHADRGLLLHRQLDKYAQLQITHGSGTEVSTLKKLDLDQQYTSFIASSANPANNLTACMLAKGLGSAITIANLVHADWTAIAFKLGVDVQISPYTAVMQHIEQIVHDSRLTNYHPLIHSDLEMVEMVVSRNSEVHKKPVHALSLPDQVEICGVVSANQGLLPKPALTLEAGDKVLVLTPPQQLDQVEAYFTN